MKISVPLFLIALSGCVASYQQNPLAELEQKLDSNLGVFVSTPENGSYSGKEYGNSGRMTADAIRSAFLHHTSKVKVSDACTGSECFSLIDQSDIGYFVDSTITHWEDRATEWSGKSDRLEIQVRIIDVVTRKEIASTIISGKSKWVTFGGDHPQDLLESPINAYVESLYK